MRTGKLAISRGHQAAEPPHLTLVPAVPQAPASPDYHAVNDRLTALERLTRLFEQGALSAEEFQAEKALVLALPADELVLSQPAPVHFVPARSHSPSLLGRMLNWKFLSFSLVTGLGFSYAAQPEATFRTVEQLSRYFA